MKLSKCDLCGKLVPVNEASSVVLKEGKGDGNILRVYGEDETTNIESIEADLCLKCAINIAHILRPQMKLIPLENYRTQIKHKYME